MNGVARYPAQLSLNHLCDVTKGLIARRYPDRAVLPVVRSPDQTDGDLAKLGIFQNRLQRGPLGVLLVLKTLLTELARFANYDPPSLPRVQTKCVNVISPPVLKSRLRQISAWVMRLFPWLALAAAVAYITYQRLWR
jgi:hypothetical protein